MKKKIFAVIISMLAFTNLYSQEQEQTNFIFKLNRLPNGLKIISANELKELTTKFDHVYAEENLYTRLYSDGNVLISIFEQKDMVKPLRRSLETYQQQVKRRLTTDPLAVIYDSKIISVNNVRYLIVKYKRRGDDLISFTSDYGKSFTKLKGLLEFKSTDRDKAELLIKNFLSNIVVKE